MARVDDAPRGNVALKFSVHPHRFQGAVQIGFVVVGEDVVDALGGILVVESGLFRVYTAQNAGHVQKDHGVGQSAPLSGFGDGFGAKAGGVGSAVVQIVYQLIGPAGPFQAFSVAGNAVVFRIGDGIKSLGKAVPALAQGFSVCRHGEVHPVSGTAVDAVVFHKIQTGPGRFQPFRPGAVQAAHVGKNPAAPSLHPNAFIGGKHLAFPGQAGVDAAVLGIHAVFEPKVHRGFKFGANPALPAAQFFGIHCCKNLLVCDCRPGCLVRALWGRRAPAPF